MYIKPTLEKSPNLILLDVGTNVLRSQQPDEIVNEIVDLAR